MKHTCNASLKHLNGFSVEAHTGQLIELETEDDLLRLNEGHLFDPDRDLVLGAGSNVLFIDDVKGTVLLNRMTGKRIINDSDNDVLIEVHSGENWHQLVMWSLQNGLSGIENLSLIPGLAGAAPVQNIGAYGVELADVLESVQVLEFKTGQMHKFNRDECQFSYRNSRFKSIDAGRFLITRIRLRLQRRFTPVLAYSGIIEELRSMGVDQPSARQVSNAVIRIRQRKLPDQNLLANVGSFFKNPIIDEAQAGLLTKNFVQLPVFHLRNDKAKLSAAWMIEQCGWKGHREGDTGVSEKHALVLVNFGTASGGEILDLANKIRKSVKRRFAVDLQIEPFIVGQQPD